jgi:cold shock protein
MVLLFFLPTFTTISNTNLLLPMQKGTVKFFNNSKGFGFIKTENEEIFVHVSGLIDEIKENDQVKFDVQQGKKGLNAINVEVI